MNKKKIVVFVACFVCTAIIVSAVCILTYFCRIKELSAMPVDLPSGFTYTAHTGCVGTQDNSLDSIRVGAGYGADIVEFDLHFYDGEPVLSHDEPKGGEVTLKEAFLLVKAIDNLRVNVDVKNTSQLSKVQEIAVETGVLDRIFFTGINQADVRIAQETCPLIPYYLNMDVLPAGEHTPEYLQSLVERVSRSGATGINFNKDGASKELVDAFHRAGLYVSVWTVNNRADMYTVLSYGPDNITTRNPDKLQAILQEKQGE